MRATVERYLKALEAKDWETFATTLAEKSFERIGPFCDVVDTKQAYVSFLSHVVGNLENYGIRVRRMQQSDRVVYAEINESFAVDGTKMDFPEVLVFDVDDDERIARVQVYMMRPGEEPPVTGARAGGADRSVG